MIEVEVLIQQNGFPNNDSLVRNVKMLSALKGWLSLRSGIDLAVRVPGKGIIDFRIYLQAYGSKIA